MKNYKILNFIIKQNSIDEQNEDSVQVDMNLDQQIKEEPIDDSTTAKINTLVNEYVNKIGNKCKCKTCNRTFRKVCDLKAHIKIYHLKLKRFRCKICNYASYYKKTIKSHLTSHNKNQERSNTIADNSTQKDLEKKELNSQKRYNKPQCHICKRTFHHMYYVRRHIRAVHLKVRPHKCSSCSHRTFSKGDLIKNMRVHEKCKNSVSRNVENISQAENLEDPLISDEVKSLVVYKCITFENKY